MLLFLRHGRTPNNAQARLQGQHDSPLDEVGRAQSRLMGEAIRAHWNVDRVITSPLQRTIQTAEEAGFGHLPRTVDDRWSEIDFGAYDDRRIGEVIAELGLAWLQDVRYAPPDGESMAQMHLRVGAALDEAFPSEGETVLVVTHATPIKSVVAWVLGGGAETILRLKIGLASVTTIERDGPGLVLSRFNWQPAAASAPAVTDSLEGRSTPA